jgi:hypothetical protein
MVRYFVVVFVRACSFWGEVTHGQEIRKEPGSGLVFVLSPDEYNGWTIRVATSRS